MAYKIGCSVAVVEVVVVNVREGRDDEGRAAGAMEEYYKCCATNSRRSSYGTRTLESKEIYYEILDLCEVCT